MFVPDAVPNGAQITKDVGFYSKVLLPALAALVPAAVGAGFKWAQDHSRSRRRVELSDRMAALIKMIADMPQIPPETMGGAPSPREILGVELMSVSKELAAVQTKVGRHVVSSATSRMRSALLLYRPHGLLAWTLHIVFYWYFFFLILETPLMLANTHDPQFWDGVLGLVVAGIPPLIVRYFAARLHRAYCAKQSPASAPPPPLPVPAGIAAPAGRA